MVQTTEHELRIYGELVRQQQDELAAVECSLTETLQAALVRFDGWCVQESALSKQRCSASARRTRRAAAALRAPSCSSLRAGGSGSEASKGVTALRQQLEKIALDIDADGGITGGWSADDHDTFLRVLTKFRRRTGADFISELHHLLPLKRHEELVAHVAWLSEYEGRQSLKRNLLEKWRAQRLSTRSGSEGAARGAARADTAQTANGRERQRTRDREASQERAVCRQRVAEWREAREMERRASEEERVRREKEAEARAARERQQRQDDARDAVAAFQQQRLADRERAGGAVFATTRAAELDLTPEKLERIAQRNATLLHRRNAQLQAKCNSHHAEQCFAPPARTSTAYEHVESRLRDHTEAYVVKVRDNSALAQSKSAPASPGNFAHQGVLRPLRSSPSWRPGFGV